WLGDPRFANARARFDNRDELRAQVTEVLMTRTSAEWIEDCNAAGLPCGPVYDVETMFADPQVEHLEMKQPVVSAELGPIELVSQPIRISGHQFTIRSAAP